MLSQLNLENHAKNLVSHGFLQKQCHHEIFINILKEFVIFIQTLISLVGD